MRTFESVLYIEFSKFNKESYDTDKHIVEVGENIIMVVRRFLNSGLSIEDIAVRMDVPIDYAKSCL